MSNEKPKQTTFFDKQRDLLISEISISMDSVLNNINSLNRSLEGTIAVGKEFDSVSNLWSHFYDGIAHIEQLKNQQTSNDKEEQQESQEQQEEIQESSKEDVI